MILTWLPAVFLFASVGLLFSLIYRPALYISIPVVLVTAAYSYAAITAVLGYPTADLSDLQKEFRYVCHMGGQGGGPAYLMAIAEGGEHPRLYYLENVDEGEESMDKARGRTADGIAQEGSFFEGELIFHDMDPAEEMGPKE